MVIDLVTLGYSRLRSSGSGSRHGVERMPETGSRSVSVLIPIFNEAEKVVSTVKCVMQQTYPIEDIYLLDDLSTDATQKTCRELEKKYEIVNHIRRDTKLGKAGNINALVAERAHALGEFILIVDGDVKLAPTCLEELVRDSGDADAVTGFGYTRQPSAYVPKMLYEGMYWINCVFSFRKKAQTIRKAVFVVCGALTMYRRDVLRSVPIPDRTLTEDTDYTWVLQEQRYTVRYSPTARAVGSDPETFRGCWKRHVRWFCGTYQCLFVHGFRELNQSKALLYSTILPGFVEAVPYSVTITLLPVIALYHADLAKGILIADFLLSAPFLFLHERGIWHALNHLPDIYVYKYFGSVVCLYAGLKTTIEKILGRTGRWGNNWENSSRANIQPRQLTKRYMRKHLEAFLHLEREWIDLGEKPWSRENFLLENPQKWKLSSYVTLHGKPVGYAIVSEKAPGQAYLHKVLVDRDYQGLGIAGRLLEDTKGKCQQRGIGTIRFKVRPDNQRANSLYRKNGVIYIDREMSADGVERYLCEWILGS